MGPTVSWISLIPESQVTTNVTCTKIWKWKLREELNFAKISQRAVFFVFKHPWTFRLPPRQQQLASPCSFSPKQKCRVLFLSSFSRHNKIIFENHNEERGTQQKRKVFQATCNAAKSMSRRDHSSSSTTDAVGLTFQSQSRKILPLVLALLTVRWGCDTDGRVWTETGCFSGLQRPSWFYHSSIPPVMHWMWTVWKRWRHNQELRSAGSIQSNDDWSIFSSFFICDPRTRCSLTMRANWIWSPPETWQIPRRCSWRCSAMPESTPWKLHFPFSTFGPAEIEALKPM